MKNFFIDTNVLIDNPFSIFNFLSIKMPEEIYNNLEERYGSAYMRIYEPHEGEGNHVYLSDIVEKELNNIKDRTSADENLKFQTRVALRILSEIRKYGFNKKDKEGIVKDGISFENGSKLVVFPHDEEKFKEKTKIHEPNNDDRLVFNYISKIQDLHKDNGASVFEIVSEDANFHSKVIDSIIDNGSTINCRPVIAERTKSMNAAEQYTGTHKNALIVEKTAYDTLAGSKAPILLEELVRFQQEANKSKVELDKIIQNEFIRIRHSPDSEEIYLRRKLNDFVPMTYFKDEMLTSHIDRQLSISTTWKEIKGLDREGLKAYVRQSDLKSKDRNRFLKKIDNTIDLASVKTEINGVIKENTRGSKPQRQTRESLLDLPFNPEIKPNSVQRRFLEYALDKDVPVVSLVSGQGVGKTVAGIIGGILNVKRGDYDRIQYMFPLIPVGPELGFLKGGIDQKISPYVEKCRIALKNIYALDKDARFYTEHPQIARPSDPSIILDNFVRTGLIDYQVMTFVEGNTIDNAFIILDEAQFFSRADIKMIIGRLGKRSKLVLLGDYGQVSAGNKDMVRKFLNPQKIGISHLIEGMCLDKDSYKNPDGPMYAHLTSDVQTSMRSRAANIANYL